jgi:hypothetical protein
MRREIEHWTPKQFHNRVRRVEACLIRRRAAQNRHSLGLSMSFQSAPPLPTREWLHGIIERQKHDTPLAKPTLYQKRCVRRPNEHLPWSDARTTTMGSQGRHIIVGNERW